MKDITNAQRKWIETMVMPNYLIYSKQNGKAYCQACKTDINANRLKIGSIVKCPHCGAEVKVKNAKYTAMTYEWGTAIIPDKNEDNEIVLRYFDISRHFQSGWRELEFKYCEVLRETFHNDGSFFVEDKRNWTDIWRACKLPIGQYRISWYTHRPLGTHAKISSDNVKIYTKNLTRLVKGTAIERVPIYKMLNCKLHDRYSAWGIIYDSYNGYANFFEYIYKVGVDNLAHQLTQTNPYMHIKGKEKSLINMLSLSKENYRELLKLGKKATIEDLNKLQRYTEFNLVNKRDREIFDKYFANNTHYAKELIKVLPITLNKFEHWAGTQDKFSISTYIDYLKMCKELELDMKNSFVSMPKELKSAHNMVVDMYNEMKFDMKLKRYADEANQYTNEYSKIFPLKEKQYSYAKDNIQIVVPKSTRDIGHEGYKLRHCVAQYMSDVVADKKTILFVRNIKEPDVPFFTMEIIGKEITQCKGYRNCPRPNEVESFLKSFARSKHLSIAKDEHFAAVM